MAAAIINIRRALKFLYKRLELKRFVTKSRQNMQRSRLVISRSPMPNGNGLNPDLADTYSFGELRTTHQQNLVLPHVKQADLR